MRTIRATHLVLGGASAFALTLACGLATPASAQALEDKAWIEVGAYWPDVDSHVRLDNKNTSAPGTNLDLEQDLALSDRDTLASVYGGWRFARKWTVIGEYYALNRSGTTSLARQVTIDDVTYDAGVTLGSSFDTDIYRLGLAYAFYRTDRAEFGGVLGAHITEFKLDVSGQGHIGAASASSQQRKRDALAPLPTLGLYGGYAVTPKFIVGGRFDWLGFKVGDYDGRLTNTELTATYNFTKNFGMGAKYRYVDYNLGINNSDWQGDVSYTYKGPVIFARLGF